MQRLRKDQQFKAFEQEGRHVLSLGSVGAIVGIASGVQALIGGDEGGGKQQQAATQRDEEARQLDAMRAQMGKEQWDIWKTQGLPVLQKLSGMATTTDRTNEEVSLASGDVKNAYAASRAALARGARMDPNAGGERTAAIMTPSYMDEAGHLSTAITNARRAERARVEDTNWGRNLQVVGAYQGLPQDAAANLSGAAAGNRASSANLLRSQAISDQRTAQQAYGGFALAANARRWMPSSSGGGSSGGNNDFYNPDYTPPPSAPDQVYPGWSDPTTINARDGGAISRRGVRSYADGGEIRGPGTGTSDSVRGRVRPGSYILSADTVRAIGTKKVREIVEKAGIRPGEGGDDAGGVPVHLSNGEYQVPPEAVSFHGEDFFHKLQQKYHRPVQSDDGLANGGVIRKRGLPKTVEDAIFRAMPDRALGRVRG